MFNKKMGFIAVIFAAILLPLSVHSAEKNNQAPDAVVKTYYDSDAEPDGYGCGYFRQSFL